MANQLPPRIGKTDAEAHLLLKAQRRSQAHAQPLTVSRSAQPSKRNDQIFLFEWSRPGE
jgi:hypothetical protein